MLNREVRVLLHSGDSGARAVGELVYASSDGAASLAATLIAAGAAKFVDWSARLLPVNGAALAASAALRKAEVAAQEARRGLWHTTAPPARDAAAAAAASGKVVEVVSGDTLLVALADGRAVRVSLASCAPTSHSHSASVCPPSLASLTPSSGLVRLSVA